MVDRKTQIILSLAVVLFASALSVAQESSDPSDPASSSDAKDAEPEDKIEFDPEKGIIMEEPEKPVPLPIERNPNLKPEAKQEDLLLEKMEGEPVPVAPVDTTRRYIDRQIDKQFSEIQGYFHQMGDNSSIALSWVLDKLIIILGFIKKWPVVESPPPLILSVPLIGLIYFLTCYPLMKIGRTITGKEWMAWVPFMQLVLLLRITERSLWTLLVFVIPVANLIFLAVIFKEISEMFRRPAWFGILILVPFLNIALLWYLAYVEFD